jgi:hypothetical protein
LKTLVLILERGVTEADENVVVNELQALNREDSGILNQLNELLIKGAIQGTAGNYLFSWLQIAIRQI